MTVNSIKKAQSLNAQYEGLEDRELLRVLLEEEFEHGQICSVSSFGVESALLLHMIAQINPATPVIFLDTQKLFEETLVYRDELSAYLGLRDVRTIYPDYLEAQRHDPEGNLWQSNVSSCCYMRKTAPLKKALKVFDAWITGRKRYQGGLRSDLPLIESFEGRVKINPLANWNGERIMAEFKRLELPPHPLYMQGFTSIGCLPCTQKPTNPDDPRSGRWAQSEKTECGIHLGEDGRFRPI